MNFLFALIAFAVVGSFLWRIYAKGTRHKPRYPRKRLGGGYAFFTTSSGSYDASGAHASTTEFGGGEFGGGGAGGGWGDSSDSGSGDSGGDGGGGGD